MASDIAIVAEEILKTRGILNGLYSKHTGQPVSFNLSCTSAWQKWRHAALILVA
jgi:ATP-dependent protease ClpP protease subunit